MLHLLIYVIFIICAYVCKKADFRRAKRLRRRLLVEENEPEAWCPICYADFTAGDEVFFHHFLKWTSLSSLPLQLMYPGCHDLHVAHSDCLMEWFARSALSPLSHFHHCHTIVAIVALSPLSPLPHGVVCQVSIVTFATAYQFQFPGAWPVPPADQWSKAREHESTGGKKEGKK